MSANSLFTRYQQEIRESRPVALATVVSSDAPAVLSGAKILLAVDQAPLGSTNSAGLDRAIIRDLEADLHAGRSRMRRYGPAGELDQDSVVVFIEVQAPPAQMLIFGAVDFSAALCRIAKVMGYRVTICDARAVFATTKRFPWADEVIVDWPHRLLENVGPTLGPLDAVCVLTHDAKFDVPAVLASLETKVGYIGAMGSRRTTEDRHQRLLDAGATEEQLTRLKAPIGLDIGARTPEETAISICAEITALRWGIEDIAPLSHKRGAIHRA